MTIEKLVHIFLDWCARHRAPATVRHYRGRLSSFVNRFGTRELSSVTPLEVEDWLADAARFPDGRPKAPDTQRANAIAFERLQGWSLDHGEIKAKIIEKLEKPRGRLRERIPTSAETDAILKSAPPAFALIYRALRQSGARPGELARAEIADWDRQAGVIVLAEHKTARKTGKPRRIAVGKKLATMLEEGIGDRTDGAIFLDPRGRKWTTASLSRTYRQLRDAAGLDKDLVLYLARHEHATQICQKLGIHAAAEALGHSNIKTTQRYLHVDDKDRQINQDKFNQ